jgi:hypothetical protein
VQVAFSDTVIPLGVGDGVGLEDAGGELIGADAAWGVSGAAQEAKARVATRANARVAFRIT